MINFQELLFKDHCIILTSTLSNKEKTKLWEVAQGEVDQRNQTYPDHPSEATEVPNTDTYWDCQENNGSQGMNVITDCITAGLSNIFHIQTNYQKLHT